MNVQEVPTPSVIRLTLFSIGEQFTLVSFKLQEHLDKTVSPR